ncbi:MAG: tRNA epoxyqueuosine(34) reductase QueG [Pyrinomonadaceae bacterium]
MDFLEKTRLVREKAMALGFSAVAIARAEKLEDDSNALNDWLENGNHGTMRWMEKEPEKRGDPTLLVEGAESVICFATNYFTPFQHPKKAKVSRYAWGDDYHLVIKSRLNEFCNWFREIDPLATTKACIDTVPILEKAWAQRAGLGWIGKHANLITRELGSWVFLSECVTTAKLVYDQPFEEDHCGTCTACIEACPTNAIIAERVVDSRKCISYATIELRSPALPEEIVRNLDGWLYGCDICQDVCPWNRFEKPSEETAFNPRPFNLNPNLLEIAALTQEEFSSRYRNSAIKRTKVSGLKRNAEALLNHRTPENGAQE